jgi:hypothetical protein
MAYSNATIANATALANATGLTVQAAMAWLLAEQQQVPNPTNPLNIEVGGTPGQTGVLHTSYGSFGTYASPQAGIAAAAWLIAHGDYAGIRAAIASANAWLQARAIDLSRWGTTGAEAALSRAASMLGGAATSAPPASPPASPPAGQQPATSSPPIYTADQWNAAMLCLASKGVRIVTAGSRPAIMACAQQAGIDLSGVDWQSLDGHSLSDLRDAEVAAHKIPPANPLNVVPDIAGAIAALPAALGAVILNLLVIAVLTLMAYRGLEMLLEPEGGSLGADVLGAAAAAG